MNSCTVTKRVHRKGWHISWHKNHRSDNSQNNETVEHGGADTMKAERGGKKVVDKSNVAEKKKSEEAKSEYKAENFSKQDPSTDSMEPTSSPETKNDAPEDELPNSESNESQELNEIPLGGAYIFLGLFIALGVGIAAFGAFEFALGALLIAIAAAIIIVHVIGIKNGKNKSHIRPSGFYNSILFVVLCSVLLAYLIIYGGLGELIGIIVAVFLVALIAMLLFLVNQTKDLHHEAVQKKKAEKEAAKKQKSEEAIEKVKKKNRIAGLIVGGLAVALFLTIALLSN